MAFAVAIEISQLYHDPWIDAIRQTTLGGLILGFGFLWSDLACYAVGVGLGVMIEIGLNALKQQDIGHRWSLPMSLIPHPQGDYFFLPGLAPYSCGVVSAPGFEIAHVRFRRLVPYRRGFDLITQHLEDHGRPKAALCGIELRSPRPFTFIGFAEFNAAYSAILEDWGLFVGGINPVARTNVAPEVDAPSEPALFGFSYTRPCDPTLPPTFVVSGAGELPEGVLAHEAIVRVGDTSSEAMIQKASFVMDLMETRLNGLGADWSKVTNVDIYTVHALERILPEVILRRIGSAGALGVCWFFSRPPIIGIEFEMDVRGVRAEEIDP